MRTLAQWLEFIERQHPKTIALGLDRVSQVFARLNVTLGCSVITVAGTNGKGSTCAMLESILRMRWDPVEDYVVDETRAVSVWIVRGTENGRAIEAKGVDLWEFRGDQVLNKDTYWKIRS